MHADRLGEVAVALGVARDAAAEARQHVERIPVVRLRKRLRRPSRTRARAAGRPARSTRFISASAALLVRHVAQAEGDADEVERAARERQLLGVAQQRRQRRRRRRAGGRGRWRSIASLMSVCTTTPRRADLASRTRAPGRRCRRRCRARGRPGRTFATATAYAFQARCRPSDIRSFITSYFGATESNTPRTRLAFVASSTVS